MNFWQKFSKLFNLFIIFLSLILVFCALGNIQPALAHSPHDDITALELSPNYQQDQTLFVLSRGNLLRSEDGGVNWQRIEKGLDKRASLYRSAASLAMSTNSPEILYLSSVGDGIYKSEDEGLSWHQQNNNLENLEISLLAIAPKSPDLVFAAGFRQGLYRTLNGGQTWETVIDDNHITAINFLPDTQGNYQILIGDHRGQLYISDDWGITWEELASISDSGRVRSIAVSPNFAEDKTFFIGTRVKGIYKTTDGGLSLTDANNGISDKSITSIEISPNYRTDSTIFVSTFREGVFESDDGGETWQQYRDGLTRNYQAEEHRRPHFSALRVSPNFQHDKTIFLAGFSGLFRSTDGGYKWQEMDTLPAGLVTGFALSPNYQQDSTLVVGTYIGGSFLSEDGGKTWKELQKAETLKTGISSRLYDLEFSPTYPEDETLFATTWQHFLVSKNLGKSWQPKPLVKTQFLGVTKSLSTKPAMAISANFKQDKTIFLATEQGHIFKSTDGGLSLRKIAELNLDIFSLVISPNFSVDQTLYAGLYYGGIYQSIDGGKTWQALLQGLPDLSSEPTQLAISPNYQTDKTLFAATSIGLFKTIDSGKNWNKIISPNFKPDSYIEAVAVSPNYARDGTVIITVRGQGLFKTVDGGKNFAPIGQDLINNNIIFSHLREFPSASVPIKFSSSYDIDQTIYGFSGLSLFKSEDGGHNWIEVTLPDNIPTPTDIAYELQEPQTRNRRIDFLIKVITSPQGRLIAASCAGILGYFLSSYFNLEKKLSLRKWQIQAGTAFAIFIIVFSLSWLIIL